jgi:galactokinase
VKRRHRDAAIGFLIVPCPGFAKVYAAGVQSLFHGIFGREASVVASAPGRVNLIGEHTDYNGGAVLPAVIPRRTIVALAPRDDRAMRVHTTFGGAATTYDLGAETRRRDCFDYVQGCTWALAEAGFAVPGCDVAIDSTVPAGSGLSSSAALEVALLRALRELGGLTVDDVALARIAHRAEHGFVGAKVGIMDQMAVSLADETAALFLDTRTLATERVPLPATVELAVVDSGVRHALVAGGYNARRVECERAAAALDVSDLCRLGVDALDRVAALPAPLDRRARHVVTEHARVGAAVAALRAGDLARVGALFAASHASQRDDYEVSVPAVDRLVAIASETPHVRGARLTGGGFGGSIVLLVERGYAAAVAADVVARDRAAGGAASVVVPVTT